MQSFQIALLDLMPVVMNPASFREDAQVARVEKDVKKLLEASRQISHSPMLREKDPTLRFVASAFHEDLRRVDEAFSMGKREYARYTLMNVTAYCIECHTRTSSGPSFQTPEIEKALVALNSLERGEYLLATRQFDRALVEFESVIRGELAKDGNLFQLDRAVRYSLAVSIKFLRNPQKALSIVEMIEKSSRSPFFLKQSARSWKSALTSWVRERSQGQGNPNELLSTSRKLIDQGKIAQSGFADRGGDVYFLRALSDLHQLMSMKISKPVLGESLFLTGVAYESVRDLSVWSLHENYFESCIRQLPASKWSAQCYKRLEESVLAGFTGSSGTRLPMDVQVRLGELKKLALSPNQLH